MDATFLIQCLNALQYGLLLFLVAGADADLRDHGRHQPGPRQLLHDRRLHGLCAGAGGGQHLRRRLLRHAGCGPGAGRGSGLCAGVGVLQLPVRARAPAAGADDLRPDPGLRGTAQPDRRRRRARRASRPTWLAGTPAAGRRDDLPGLPAVHQRRVPGAGAGHVVRVHPHPAGHDDPRRQHQPRDGAEPGHRHQVPLPRGVCRRRGGGGAGRHGGRAGVVGLPGHGQPGADHLLRGGGDRRHRLDPRRAAGRAADRRGRHLRQGAAAPRPPACWSMC
jgi:hypothetical protein